MRGQRLLAVAALVLVTGCGTSPPAAVPPSPRIHPSPAVSARRTPSPSPTSLVPPNLSVPPLPTSPVTGADISWPNCPRGMGIPQKRSEGAPMPLASARFVVLGLTNGPGFVANPCLASQLAWVQSRHLLVAAYSIVSWPNVRIRQQYRLQGPYDASTRLGGLRNVGYQQARYNVATMQRVGLQTPAVWVDVEPVSHFDWTRDARANTAVVVGAIRGYRDAGYRVGVYSVTSLWSEVVGGLRLGLPEWRAVGEDTRAEALRHCAPSYSVQGGQALLAQWVDGRRDRDVTCPRALAQLEAWFHRS